MAHEPPGRLAARPLDACTRSAGAGDDGIDFLIEARIIRERLQKTIRRGAQCERVRAVQSANQRQGDSRLRVGQQFENRGNVGGKIVNGDRRDGVGCHGNHDSPRTSTIS